ETFFEYEKRKVSGQVLISTHSLTLPPVKYETTGFWIEIEEFVKRMTENSTLHFMGGIHALEHCLISLFPLFALCDRFDIGGISTPFHPQVEKGAVFIYDGHPGGVGLTDRGYETIEKLLLSAHSLISSCSCETGCPSCIHSPKCGSGNKPLDKRAAAFILELLLAKREIDVKPQRSALSQKRTRQEEGEPSEPEKRVCVFDLETQRSAEEVGGWQNSHLMRMSVGVVFDFVDKKYFTYNEGEASLLLEKLEAADIVVGFNINGFDMKVLSPYATRGLKKITTFDMLSDIRSRLGYRLSLDHLARQTLKAKKSGDGLLALRWFKEGNMARLSEYCTKDVEITKKLFNFGRTNRYVLFEKKGLGTARLVVDWSLKAILPK
ncbi:MAG: Zn-binding domain-containing protein, partial [Nitrospinota bacterium]